MATIKEIKDSLAGVDHLDHPLFQALSQDERQGVQKLLQQKRKQLKKEEAERQRVEQLAALEVDLHAQGYTLIAGIDEVGRGPLAGPVVAAAVILPPDCRIFGINDSKKLSKKKLLALDEEIRSKALAFGIGQVDAAGIDAINIYQASKLAMKEALANMSVTPDYLLIDAMELDVPTPQASLIKGDARCQAIAAASIVAKVARDRLMEEYDQVYPGYDFAQNVGYGTAKHLQGIQKLGPCPIHRMTFAPLKKD